jgi:hypothetical protein
MLLFSSLTGGKVAVQWGMAMNLTMYDGSCFLNEGGARAISWENQEIGGLRKYQKTRDIHSQKVEK